MTTQQEKGKVLAVLERTPVAAVATSAGRALRNRMMHYAFDEDLNCYLASMKGDPKTVQITHHPSVALLVYDRDDEIGDSREVEISGKAVIVKDRERAKALDLNAQRSPVVAHLVEAGNEAVLDCIKVTPEIVKLRVFREIVQGMPPTVIEFPENRTTVSDWALFKTKLSSWRVALRLSFLTASLVPVLLGTAMAWAGRGAIHWGNLALTLISALLLHSGANLLNDYFDHLSGGDEANIEYVRPFSGGSRVIQLGLLAPLEVLVGGLVLFAVACAIGLYLAWVKGPLILVLGAIGVASGLFYTAPVFNWASRGLGELLAGLNFGVLMTVGAYFVQAGSLELPPVVASVLLAFFAAAVLFVNEFPDYRADRAVGKSTLVVRLGRRRSTVVFGALMASAYVVLMVGVFVGALPPATLFGLVTLPLSWRAVQYVRQYHTSSFDLVPANALTVITHLATGLLLALAYAWQGFGRQGWTRVAVLGVLSAALAAYVHRYIERQKDRFLSVRQAVR